MATEESLGRFIGFGPVEVSVGPAPDSADWQVSIRMTHPSSGEQLICMAPADVAIETGTALMAAARIAQLRNMSAPDLADRLARETGLDL